VSVTDEGDVVTDVACELDVGTAVAGREAFRVAVARATCTVQVAAGTRSLHATRAVLARAAESRADTATCLVMVVLILRRR